MITGTQTIQLLVYCALKALHNTGHIHPFTLSYSSAYMGDFWVHCLPHDTLANIPEEPGMEPPTPWLVDDLLYCLSRSLQTFYQQICFIDKRILTFCSVFLIIGAWVLLQFNFI